MAIDIRASVTCSLGTLISASISDDYLQGTGLVKCKGSCEISGIITPAIGTVVTFSYTQDGVTHQVPRKLRVLSSFADPFRRTTRVELGCKLTYLQDLKEPVDWTAFDDPENSELTEADAEIITIPIHASSVMAECLSQLGITASSNPLTNKFSIANFDFSPGYVQVLGDLLVSESYCGYLNTSEVLQVFSLDQAGGTGPVLGSSQIIDLGPIGVGQLPGEAVTVSYSTLKLRADDVDQNSTELGGWNSTSSVSFSSAVIQYTDASGAARTVTYPTIESIYQEVTYQTLVKASTGESVNVVRSRSQVEAKSSVTVLGSFYSQCLSNGIDFGNFTVYADTYEDFSYDAEGNETSRILTKTGNFAFLAGSAGVPLVFSDGSYYSPFGERAFLEQVIVRSDTFSDYTSSVTERYVPWLLSVWGQQAMAESGTSVQNVSEVANLLNGAGSGKYLLDVRAVVTRSSSNTQQAPSEAELNNRRFADQSGNPNNGYRTESKASLELALGSATAQRRIEFSLPYAPDDTFVRLAGSPVSYRTIRSDAAAKANRYGRTQNRLLLGNRSGMNIQVAAPILPSAPFAPVVVQADGLSAMYRINGTSWTMDNNGIVASTDALFWGAIGSTS